MQILFFVCAVNTLTMIQGRMIFEIWNQFHFFLFMLIKPEREWQLVYLVVQ